MRKIQSFAQGVHLKKSLGQHLLVDTRFLDEIVCSSSLQAHDKVLEIGAGSGLLTERLLEQVEQVVAVEVDRQFESHLEKLRARYPNSLTVVFGDVRKLPLRDILGSSEKGWKVVANIPYYITSPLLELLLVQSAHLFTDLFLMVQKEIAVRLEGSDSRNVSSLSLVSHYYAVSEMLFHIPPSAFMPPPKVDSTFIHLAVRSAPPVSAPRELLFSLVRSAFGQRRKGIRNSLKSFSPHIDDTILRIALEKCGIDPLERPQNLTLADFDRLAHALLEGSDYKPADFSS